MSTYSKLGRSVVTYLIIGLVIGLAVGFITYIIQTLASTILNAESTLHQAGMNALNITVPTTPIQVGNTTVNMPAPSNQALNTAFNALQKVLAIVLLALGSTAVVAVMIALGIISLSQND